jgi:hypothetical protein
MAALNLGLAPGTYGCICCALPAVLQVLQQGLPGTALAEPQGRVPQAESSSSRSGSRGRQEVMVACSWHCYWQASECLKTAGLSQDCQSLSPAWKVRAGAIFQMIFLQGTCCCTMRRYSLSSICRHLQGCATYAAATSPQPQHQSHVPLCCVERRSCAALTVLLPAELYPCLAATCFLACRTPRSPVQCQSSGSPGCRLILLRHTPRLSPCLCNSKSEGRNRTLAGLQPAGTRAASAESSLAGSSGRRRELRWCY